MTAIQKNTTLHTTKPKDYSATQILLYKTTVVSEPLYRKGHSIIYIYPLLKLNSTELARTKS